MLKRVRCAIYTRKSSDEGLEQSFNSLHAQREACEAYIASQKHEGWQIIPTAYDDGGFSGGNMARPGLKALLDDVAAGLVDAVVVYKVDRLSRHIGDFLKMVERFDAKDVSFVSVTQAFNTTTSMGRLMLNVLLSFAQFEREVAGERIRDKIAASKAKGMWMGGTLPLGYRSHERTLIAIPKEAEHVRTLFELYTKLKSVDDVADKAFELGIRAKIRRGTDGKILTGGGRIQRGPLYRILTNRIYLGLIEHKGSIYPGLHDGIVAPELFEKVQKILDAQRRKGKGTATTRTAMLSGLVVDAADTRLKSTHTKKGDTRYRYYAGGGLRIPAQDLEDRVADSLAKHLSDPGLLGLLWGDLALLSPEVVSTAAAVADTLAKARDGGRRQIAEELIEQIIVAPKQLTIRIKLEPIGLSGIGSISIATTIARLRTKLSLVVPGAAAAMPDPALIAMVAQARSWFEQIASGEAGSFREIARIEQVSEDHVRKTLPAAFMAPDIVARIVEGRQPATLTATRLKELLPLPSNWTEQRAVFAEMA